MSFKGSRVPDAESDRGSMLMALLVTLVGISLSAIMVPIVVGQVTSTRVISGRTQALDAAQTGIDVALGQLRSAVVAGKGSLEDLPPCEMVGSMDTDKTHYRVTIAYFGLAQPTVAMTCPLIDVPIRATLSATGGGPSVGPPAIGSPSVGSAGTRTIEATYTFRTNIDNISGGPIQLATNSLCMDAGKNASPAPGDPLTMQPCQPGGSSDQRFAYTPDLNIKLVGSQTTSAPKGMCLEAPTPHANGGLVSFQACVDRTARQQWSLNDSSKFEGTDKGIILDKFCFNLRTAGVPSDVILGGCGTGENQSGFRPQTGVGAGMASTLTGQVVNYLQFSRCLDVTGKVIGTTYEIVWFCKQAPDGNVAWNQKWALPIVTVNPQSPFVGRIRTDGPDKAGYCLNSPRSTAAKAYARTASCPAASALADAEAWIVYGLTPSYATSYTIVDKSGFCLTPTDLKAVPPDTHPDGTSRAKVAVCDGSELQKWNAPPTLNEPLVLTNTREK